MCDSMKKSPWNPVSGRLRLIDPTSVRAEVKRVALKGTERMVASR